VNQDKLKPISLKPKLDSSKIDMGKIEIKTKIDSARLEGGKIELKTDKPRFKPSIDFT
jgi:hypothetical protein